uniref:Uncharacterized protein n=1 Tax=Opuntia streptacantha TaxID=393608 RepID=A0A7C8ZUC5_OPUST
MNLTFLKCLGVTPSIQKNMQSSILKLALHKFSLRKQGTELESGIAQAWSSKPLFLTLYTTMLECVVYSNNRHTTKLLHHVLRSAIKSKYNNTLISYRISELNFE